MTEVKKKYYGQKRAETENFDTHEGMTAEGRKNAETKMN